MKELFFVTNLRFSFHGFNDGEVEGNIDQRDPFNTDFGRILLSLDKSKNVQEFSSGVQDLRFEEISLTKTDNFPRVSSDNLNFSILLVTRIWNEGARDYLEHKYQLDYPMWLVEQGQLQLGKFLKGFAKSIQLQQCKLHIPARTLIRTI